MESLSFLAEDDGSAEAQAKLFVQQMMAVSPPGRGWIGFDLDGTLAHYENFISLDHIGDPIPHAVAMLKALLEAGYEVKIFTARVCELSHEQARGRGEDHITVEYMVNLVQDWCEQHIGHRLEVTNVKDFKMILLIDDRCAQIERNTGVLVALEHSAMPDVF